jgi:hypothetical protein
MIKRGQTTAFIIVAIIIVMGGIVVYMFYPRISSVLGFDSEPSDFIKNCVEPEVTSGIDLLSKQGGYADPQGYITYKGNDVKYLCYTSEYYVPCFVQQPLLRQHFEEELGRLASLKADECVSELRNYYESRGYDVSNVQAARTSVEIIPEQMTITVTSPLTITKETTQSFREFKFVVPTKMYTLLMTANSIIDFESTYGNTDTLLYLRYYPNLQVQKDKLGDGSTIYTVRDINSDEKFTFASRSLVWPGGYGLS